MAVGVQQPVEVQQSDNANVLGEKEISTAHTDSTYTEHLETRQVDESNNLVYANEEEEPQLHFPTYCALASIYLVLAGQGLIVQGPSAIISFIGNDIGGQNIQTWIPNAMNLVSAAIGPVLCSVADLFQMRKSILLISCAFVLVGTVIAATGTTMTRVIVAQAMIGVGLAALPLSYVIPSEILPRKWRPMAQAFGGISSALLAVTAPVIAGALIKRNPKGWRQLYWIIFAVWGLASLGILFGYRPPKRHTRYDNLTFWHKIRKIDLPGFALFTLGLALFSVGLSIGGGLYSWKNVRTLATVIIGFVTLVAFGLYEWKGTKHGILDHQLFRGGKSKGRLFAISNGLIFLEGLLVMPFFVFYSVVTNLLFTTDPLMSGVRLMPFWGCFLLSAPIWGLLSTKFRTIREPLFVGYLMMAAAAAGMATLQPGDDANQIAFAAIGGIGFGSPLILITAGVQLAVPHSLIATATAVTNSARALGGTIIIAACSTAFTNQLNSKLPSYLAEAAAGAGLPPASIPAFVGAMASNNQTALALVPDVTQEAIMQGAIAAQQAFADSLRIIWIIAAPFGLVGCILCVFVGDLKKTMNYAVDAPVESLQVKHHHDAQEAP